MANLFAIRAGLLPTFPGSPMPLTKAVHYRAYAAASLANAEAAVDRKSRDVHLAIAEHFYLLAEDEISRVDPKRQPSNSAPENPDRRLARAG
jgi:hypothetical protein